MHDGSVSVKVMVAYSVMVNCVSMSPVIYHPESIVSVGCADGAVNAYSDVAEYGDVSAPSYVAKDGLVNCSPGS